MDKDNLQKDNLQMVFLGTHTFTFDLPATAEMEVKEGWANAWETVDVPGFEAVCTFRNLDELQSTDEPMFSYAQAVCVSKIQDWDFRGMDFSSVLVSHEAVRWVLCFPVGERDWDSRGLDGHYVPQTQSVPPDGDDIFYSFASAVSPGAPVHAVPNLDNLKFLSPRPGDKLAVVRASDWQWDDRRDTAYILPQDVIEVETVSKSEVRLL
jgi:hypothetical protein